MGHCDDPLWLILAVTDYLKETGDLALLDHVEPYADQKHGTILEHLLAVVNFVRHNVGAHGLPIFGRGDWNDTLDYIGGDDGGESVWGGMFYVAMLNHLIELLTFRMMTGACQDAQTLRNRLVQALSDHCWDGEWFIRAFGAHNRKIGSRECKSGKIFINAQSWAMIAQIPDRDRLITAIDSVRKHLESGVKCIFMDNQEIQGTILPITEKELCQVQVIMGK